MNHRAILLVVIVVQVSLTNQRAQWGITNILPDYFQNNLKTALRTHRMFLPAKNLETGKWTEMGEDATSYLNTFIAARLDTGGKKHIIIKNKIFKKK